MLSRFNKIVLIIALIVLIFSLLLIGYLLNISYLNDTYPPVISDCPDYWDVSLNSNNSKLCINKSKVNIGSQMRDCRSFSTDLFRDTGRDEKSVICAKKKKANTCIFTWDGITNNSLDCNESYLG